MPPQISATIQLSNRKDRRKKFMATVVIEFGNGTERKRTVHFGGVREDGEWYDDYTTGGNRRSYISRHRPNEKWATNGRGLVAAVTTAGFWSRWMLWEKPTYDEALEHISAKFGIDIDNRIST